MNYYSCNAELRSFLSEKFGRDLSDLAVDAPLTEELGLDSLDSLELMCDIENHFNVYFLPEHLSQVRVLGNVLEALENLTWKKAS